MRGLALRVMSSIRLPDLIQIQILAIRKCSTDRSPYVRKCACIALAKAHSLDPTQLPHLQEVLAVLLDDASTMVLGSAVAAFNEMCPLNFSLIHPCYRKLCHLLPDLEEWAQAPLLGLLTRYVRTCFSAPPDSSATVISGQTPSLAGGPKKVVSAKMKRRVAKTAFYSDDEVSDDEIEEVLEEDPYVDRAQYDRQEADVGCVFTGAEQDAELGASLDPDHALLLKTSLSLLKSRNACVVLAVCTLHHYCGPSTRVTSAQVSKALIRILKNSRETQFVVLSSIKSLAQENPGVFAPYLTDFFVRLSDPLFNRCVAI